MSAAEVIDAVTDGDTGRLRDLLAGDSSLAQARDRNGVSAVLLARYGGHSEALEALLATRPELDVYDAAATGVDGRLAELIAAEPDALDTPNVDGFTALQLAAFFGHARAARMLLDAGADPHATSGNGMALQALHSAAAAGHTGIARLLLEAGADPDAHQAGGFTPLIAADQNGDGELRDLLLAHGATDDG